MDRIPIAIRLSRTVQWLMNVSHKVCHEQPSGNQHQCNAVLHSNGSGCEFIGPIGHDSQRRAVFVTFLVAVVCMIIMLLLLLQQ
jgi:uncharacterized membrane protein